MKTNFQLKLQYYKEYTTLTGKKSSQCMYIVSSLEVRELYNFGKNLGNIGEKLVKL